MSRRERQRRRHRRRGHPGRRVAAFSVGFVVAIVAIAGLSAVGYVISVAESAPAIESLRPADKGRNSAVYAADGTRLGFIESDTLRTPLPFARMPASVREATVAIEDRRFYDHKGVDYEGVIRAAVTNLRNQRTVEGGSTITMQLVRSLYIDNERTFERKIREAKLAEELENQRSKNWILGQYLNNVPYGTVNGQTAIGIQAAARIYFNKPADELRLHEAALLAGLPQAPSVNNPFLNPEGAIRRRNEVLDAMAEQGFVTRVKAERAKRRSLSVEANRYYTKRKESYFFDYVKDQLIDRYGVNTVRRGGLSIHTTIDLEMQEEARRAINSVLNQPGDPASAIVSIDPDTGWIRAMATSGSYGRNKFNYAAQGHRQPGSTFKTMVLMAALRRGIDPERTTYNSRPLNITNSRYGPWQVKTYDNSYGGNMNLVRATLSSDNSVYAQLILDIGPEAVREAAYDMGIETRLQAFPAEGLGGLETGVSPLELANAYATIASGGIKNRPTAIRRVEFPDGRTDNLGRPKRKRTFKASVAYEAQRILELNVQRGTGRAALQAGCPVAGKTGTTDSFKDAWFAGFSPNLATTVWVGYPIPREMRSVHGISVAGGTFPTEIWGRYMRDALGGACQSFQRPAESFESSPFFGEYSRTGRRGTEIRPDGGTNGGGTTLQPPGTDEATQGVPGTDGNTDADRGGGGTRFDPDFYEAPPQDSPGNGNGNGGGNGNGNGGGRDR